MQCKWQGIFYNWCIKFFWLIIEFYLACIRVCILCCESVFKIFLRNLRCNSLLNFWKTNDLGLTISLNDCLVFKILATTSCFSYENFFLPLRLVSENCSKLNPFLSWHVLGGKIIGKESINSPWKSTVVTSVWSMLLQYK